MISKLSQAMPWLVAFLSVLTISTNAQAQGNTFNPYGNSGYADYREFASPSYSNNPALPGQAVINSKPLISQPRANSFQQYVNELEGSDSSSTNVGRGVTSNLPYYQAYQRLNPKFDRVYRPGDTKEDRSFFDRQRQREADYAAALREPNPAKRAKLLRQIEQQSLFRPSSAKPAKPGAALRPSNSMPNESTPTSPRTRAPLPENGDRTTTPLDRRSSVSSPDPSTNARRPISSAPSARSSIAPPGSLEAGRARTRGLRRPAPDPSTIPIPPPR